MSEREDILKILEDDAGNVWCTCATGLAVYNIKTGKINSFSKDDGMPISDFGGWPQNACKTQDGQLIFGAGRGALGFSPDQLKINSVIPPIHLTDFKIFHESIKLDTVIQFAKAIELHHDQNAFSIEFVALNYINSIAYNNLRRLGNSEVVTENPRVGSLCASGA